MAFSFRPFCRSGVHVTSAFSGEAAWQSEWEKVIKAAELEGEVVYSPVAAIVSSTSFTKRFLKSRTTICLGVLQ